MDLDETVCMSLIKMKEDLITIQRHSIASGKTLANNAELQSAYMKLSGILLAANSLILDIALTSFKTSISIPPSRPPADTPSGKER